MKVVSLGVPLDVAKQLLDNLLIYVRGFNLIRIFLMTLITIRPFDIAKVFSFAAIHNSFAFLTSVSHLFLSSYVFSELYDGQSGQR